MSETMDSAAVDPANAAQAAAWDGDEGAFWAAHADRFDDSVATHHRALMAAADIASADRVLDVGCGTGQTSRNAGRAASAGAVLGVDLSSAMLEVARRRAAAEGLTHVVHLQADAQVHPFEPASFDVAISRTGSMFFGDPAVAFANIGASLRQGARLALLTWQPLPRNEWIREFATALASGRDLPVPSPEAPGPFSLSDPARVRALLDGAGFTSVDCQPLDAPMRFGAGVEDAYDFVLGLSGWMADGLDEAGRARALAALRRSIEAHATPDGVVYGSAAWVVTARRS